MAYVLLVGEDSGPLDVHKTKLQNAGYDVVAASSAAEALARIAEGRANLVVTLTHAASLELLATIHGRPVESRPAIERTDVRTAEPQAHAAARWAKAIVPLVECGSDPRTVAAWSRWIAASPGAIKNWCATAGIGARRSLVFARILRAVVLSEGGRRKPENLLDIVDRRTLAGLLRLAGLVGGDRFPRTVEEFLEQQILVRDPAALSEVRRLLADRERTGNSLMSVRGPQARVANLRIAPHDAQRRDKPFSIRSDEASIAVPANVPASKLT